MQSAQAVVRLYHTILSHLNYGILVVGADEHIAFVNERFCAQLSLTVSPEEIIGLTAEAALMHILPAYEDPPGTLRLIQEMVSRGGPVLGVETRLKNSREILVDYVPIVVDGQNHGRIWQHRDITERKQIERERERLNHELQEAQSRIRVLDGLLPICATCKKIRNEQGNWEQMEGYITRRSEAAFSHGICPDCAVGLLAEIEAFKRPK
jgi:PAS domain S-box-containing protein